MIITSMRPPLALRQMVLVKDKLPKYLLMPKVSLLRHYVLGSSPQNAAAPPMKHWSTHEPELTWSYFFLAPPWLFVKLTGLYSGSRKPPERSVVSLTSLPVD
ncbi:phage integrase family protein [Klebsiella pneumoniae]|nr:phage integrase family protein [Klebsiella pneumoniae]